MVKMGVGGWEIGVRVGGGVVFFPTLLQFICFLFTQSIYIHNNNNSKLLKKLAKFSV